MPNRIIKESICTSDQIDRLSPFAEICFYRLIVNCDDYGRLDARPALLRARLFPLRNVSNGEIEEAMDALQNAGLIARYVIDDRTYLCLTGWNRNQKVRTRRMKYPAPPGWMEGEAADSAIPDKQQTADYEQQSAEREQQTAEREQQTAEREQQTAERVQQSADREQQTVSECVLNPIQSESQSESESQSRSESGTEGKSVSSKKDKEIYHDNWRYSPRARAATAQILVDRFHRERLACTEIRDLFVVVERALSLGIPPDDIIYAARRLRASAFAARYMSIPDSVRRQ